MNEKPRHLPPLKFLSFLLFMIGIEEIVVIFKRLWLGGFKGLNVTTIIDSVVIAAFAFASGYGIWKSKEWRLLAFFLFSGVWLVGAVIEQSVLHTDSVRDFVVRIMINIVVLSGFSWLVFQQMKNSSAK